MAMLVGKIKWFNDRKGFGFIEGGDNQDIFVHHTAIITDGYRTLEDGDIVEYECLPGPKGVKALSVRRIASARQASTAQSDTRRETQEHSPGAGTSLKPLQYGNMPS
jgi:CspA family cold shock protein